MKFLDYSNLFDGEPAELACLSTFNFEPDFFERRLLRTDVLGKARRIMVLMDAGQWRKLLMQDAPARWLNRRYLVVPIRRSQGVFHPKLNLLANVGSATVHCGSANLTRAGCSHNLELLNCIRAKFDDGTPMGDKGVINAAFTFFKRAIEDSFEEPCRIATTWMTEAAQQMPWFDAAAVQGSVPYKLVHTYEHSLWQTLLAEFGATPPIRAFVISPFHDADAALYSRIKLQWPHCQIVVVAQEGTTGLPVDRLVQSKARVRLEVLSNTSRRLHAKLIVLEGRQKSVALIGSANFTTAALDGRNIETCLLIQDAADAVEALFDSQLPKREMPLAEFSGSAETEPGPLPEDGGVKLGVRDAVLLPSGQVKLNYFHRFEPPPESLSATFRIAGEQRPRLSVPLPKRQHGAAVISVHESALADVHGSVLVSIAADTEAGRVESVPVWLIQEARLTHEASGEHSQQRQKVIEETGNGLAEYLEELGKTGGVAAVVEYLRHLNIRFFDGSGGLRLAKQFHLQQHDPFHPDISPDWMLNFNSPPAELEAAIYEFLDRHEKQRLRRHAQRGNINGMENFLDILSTMVRLLHVYYQRQVIPKGQLIGRLCTYLEIALAGFDRRDDSCVGYLSSLSNNLKGEQRLLRDICVQNNYAGHMHAILFTVQMARFNRGEILLSGKQTVRPSDCLPQLALAVERGLAAARLSTTTEQVVAALQQYNMLSVEALKSWTEQLAA